MSKYTDRLDNISNNHYTGSADCNREPSGLLRAVVTMHYSNNIAHGFNRVTEPSEALLKEAGKDNSAILDVAMMKRSQSYNM